MLLLELPIVNWIAKKSLPEHQITFKVNHPLEVAPFLAKSLGNAPAFYQHLILFAGSFNS